MPDVTVKSIEDMEAIYGGLARRARAELGVTAWGMQVFTLPPVAEGPLPAKEGVDAYLARLCAPISSCSPGTGTGRNRSRCMPGGSWRDDTHGFQPRSV